MEIIEGGFYRKASSIRVLLAVGREKSYYFFNKLQFKASFKFEFKSKFKLAVI